MAFLLLNIVLSSVFILAFRWLQGRDEDLLNIGAVNYIAGAVVGLAIFLCGDAQAYSRESCTTGLVNGVAYFVAFFFLLWTLNWKGAALTAVVARLSILMPVVCGIVIWGERPTTPQWVGIALAVLSLALVGRRGPLVGVTDLPRGASVVIVLFFLIAGSSRLSQEAFKHMAEKSELPSFLVAGFGIAALGSAVLLVWRGKRPSVVETGLGAAIGLCNVLQTFFILKALEHFDGCIVFPVTSAGGLLLTTLVAVFWLKERLAALSYAGISLAAAALILLNSPF